MSEHQFSITLVKCMSVDHIETKSYLTLRMNFIDGPYIYVIIFYLNQLGEITFFYIRPLESLVYIYFFVLMNIVDNNICD